MLKAKFLSSTVSLFRQLIRHNANRMNILCTVALQYLFRIGNIGVIGEASYDRKISDYNAAGVTFRIDLMRGVTVKLRHVSLNCLFYRLW